MHRGFSKKMLVQGFTIVELVAVLLITGIIAAVVMPRFIGRNSFDEMGFFDQSLNMVRYAQKLAIAQRRTVWVNLDAASNTICLSYDTTLPTCTTEPTPKVVDPANDQWFSKSAPNNVTLATTASFSFSPLGRPNLANNLTITITNAGSFVVERETGYVHL
jgi:MSHA pilin protein MshC